jgi:hypothetical protein
MCKMKYREKREMEEVEVNNSARDMLRNLKQV